MATQRRASEHGEQRQEIDRAGQDQPRPSALCREAEQERRCDQRQQQPERVDAAVEFEFPIGIVGLPARETHVRLNALCPGSSSIVGIGRSQAIQTDLLRKLIERAAPVVIAAVGNARATPVDVIDQDVDSAIDVIDAFGWLHREGAHPLKIMSIGFHLRIIGQPGRIAALHKILGHIADRGRSNGIYPGLVGRYPQSFPTD